MELQKNRNQVLQMATQERYIFSVLHLTLERVARLQDFVIKVRFFTPLKAEWMSFVRARPRDILISQCAIGVTVQPRF